MPKPLGAVVLAAGQGKRIRASERDDTPKVMKRVCGVPLIGCVLAALSFVPPERTAIVVGFGRGAVIEYCSSSKPGYMFPIQHEQRGTGDAAMAAAACFAGFEGDLLVTAGDMPLVSESTYTALVAAHREGGNACTVLSGVFDDPAGYGRVLRGGDGAFRAIREHRDCSPEELAVRECNASIYVFDGPALFAALPDVTPKNAQGEYYLTDVPHILLARGLRVGVCTAPDARELVGVNDLRQLEAVEREMAARGLSCPE